MKRLFLRFPTAARFLLAILLGVSALVLTGLIHKVLPIPFIDVTLLAIATWILSRTDGKSLRALGLNVTVKHFFFLILGLVIGVVALGLETLLRTIYTREHWNINSSVNQLALWKTLYFLLPSVVVQELMFRGYLFTKTIEVTNLVTANVIFSILFMLVHVLDKDALHNTGQLVFLAVSIPVGHLLYATALLNSKTLYFPIGLHWGNNWASFCLIGYGKNENVIFPITNQQVFTSWIPFVVMLLIFNVFFLLVTLVIWKWNTNSFSRALYAVVGARH